MRKSIHLSLALAVVAATALGSAIEVYAKSHDNGSNAGSFINSDDGINTAKTTARGGTVGGLVGNGNPNGGNSANAPGASQGQTGPN